MLCKSLINHALNLRLDLPFLIIMALTAPGSTVSAQTVDFNRDIRPLLTDRCFACHGPDDATREAKLRLDDPAALAAEKRPIIVPGKSAESLLVQRIHSQNPEEVMPPAGSGKSLNDAERELLTRWIDQGARFEIHWAYRPPVRHQPPQVEGARSDIDRFILGRMHQEGLTPSPDADRVTLIRRLYFDLTGLPPKWEAVQAFVNDAAPDAYEKIVDELLTSPHFGERLALYWLDVVRFADTNGYHSDEARQIGPFREYVIQSFNRNKPYDQFIIEQLSGDLLPDATTEQQVASGFNMLLQTTSEGGAQAKEYIAKYAADRVRNTSQIFIGSTMGCCECHNHKFDPFTTKDFYSFAAFFADIDQPSIGNPANYPVIGDEASTKLADFDKSLADLRIVLAASTPELESAQKVWETTTLDALKHIPQLGSWSGIGPFKAESFDAAYDTAYVDPSAIDLVQSVGEQKWVEAAYEDGKVHHFDMSDNSAHYLTRTITTAQAADLDLSLGSDDAITVWLNGTKVHDNKIARGAAADQDKIRLTLQAGENRILMKIVNGAAGFGFYFNATVPKIADNVAALLAIAGMDRSQAQKDELAAHFRTLSPLLQPTRDQLAAAEGQRKEYEASLPRTMMTRTAAPREIKLLNRGNWMDESGAVMEPAIPAFLGSVATEGRRSNRLDLAQWIVRRDNPLTARTMVNRLWKLYFGHGLATPLDDLGRQGVLPTHPELLDWLAVEFMDSQWDLKHMIRLMVTSSTYRHASNVTDDVRSKDANNKWYGRQTRMRLEAELVRDNALDISGLLVKQIGGASVYPYQPAGYWRHLNFPMREWPGDSGNDLYRRGIYTWWQRMFMHPSLKAFDAPSREECTVERPRSNIPQQALVLMNDPIYVEASRAFAVRMLTEGGASDSDGIQWAFRTAVSREATSEELAVLTELATQYRAAFTADAKAKEEFLAVGDYEAPATLDKTDLAAWTGVARVILNLSETITRP